MTIVAIDIGGSGSRLRVVGETVHEVRGPALTIADGRVAFDRVLAELTASLPPLEVSAVAAAAAGVTSLGDPAVLGAELLRRFRANRAVVVPDVVASLVSIWSFGGGAVVAAGTGAIGLGTDFSSTWVRSDGWGHLVGDAGGGAWIGARGIAAALRAFDGRPGGSAVLLERLRERYGDPARIPALLREAANEATVLASFVPEVAAAAIEGDDVSRTLLAEAGRLLAETASAVLIEGVPKRVALIGGLRGVGDALHRPFRSALLMARPGVEVALPDTTTLDGAVTLAEDASRVDGQRSHPPFVNIYDAVGGPFA